MKKLLQIAQRAALSLAFALPFAVQAQDQLDTTTVTGASSPPPVRTPQPAPTPPPVVEPTLPPEPAPPIDIVNEVSALKTGTPLLDIPRSLTVFSDERIEEQGITSLGEIIDYTPGVNTTQGEGHRDAIVFRGVRSTADFYVDGVRDDVQYYRPLYNVERVEILRGPSALHFGRGGTGGVLNRVMKKPVIGEEFGAYQISGDTFGAALGEFDYNQSLYREGSSIGEGGKAIVTPEPWAAFRVNAFAEYLNNHRDFFEGERFGVNPTVAFDLGPDTRLDISYEWNDHERFIDRGIPTGPNGRPVSALNGVVFGDPDQNVSSLESHLARIDLNHRFSDTWKGRVTAFYGDYDKSFQNFYASDYNQAANEVTIDGYVDHTKRSNLVFSGDLIGEFDTFNIGHKVIVGGEYIDTSSDQNRFNSFWDTSQADTEVFTASNFRLNGGSAINTAGQRATNSFSTDLADDTRVGVETVSAYVQDEIALHRMLDLVVGARYDRFDIDVLNAANGERRSRTDEEISPRLGVIVKPWEEVSLYSSYSESFLPRSGEQFANINGDNNALDPNTYSNLEYGIKWDIKPDLSLTLAYFQGEESSPQVSDGDSSTLDIIDTETSGFEAQLVGKVTDWWYIAPGYTYLDSEQVDSGGPTGLRARELPEHSASIWNRFRINDRLGFGLGAVYQDESFIDNGNTAVLPSYTRLDAAIYYQLSERLLLQVNFENLTDKEYYPNSHSNHQVTVGRPFNAAISIKGTF
tara:strand:+ start:10511 stop:12751 length:2241 start_codon:yes stop_codon:yes gene_type:complete